MMPTFYLKAIIYLVIVIGSASAGWQVQGWRKDSQIHAMQEEAQVNRDKALANLKRLEDERSARLDVVAQLDVERQRKAEVIERVITNDVIKYVQTPGAARCGIDAGGLRLINASAAGRMPDDAEAGREPDAGAAGLTAASHGQERDGG